VGRFDISSEDINILSPCAKCKNKYLEAEGCVAFPRGEIPDTILFGKNKHTVPWPSQKNKIVFEPRDEEG